MEVKHRSNKSCSGQLGFNAIFECLQYLSQIPFSSLDQDPPSCHERKPLGRKIIALIMFSCTIALWGYSQISTVP